MWAAVRENGDFFCTCGSNNWETVEDGYMLRGVWQAWQCFSVHAKFSAIGQTAFPGERKTRLKWQNAVLYKIWTLQRNAN